MLEVAEREVMESSVVLWDVSSLGRVRVGLGRRIRLLGGLRHPGIGRRRPGPRDQTALLLGIALQSRDPDEMVSISPS